MKKTEHYAIFWLAGALLMLLAFPPLHAREVAGVELAESVQINGADSTLVLNGAGIRKKWFVKVYVGALYLPEKTQSANQAINFSGAKRIAVHVVYDEVSAKKLNAAWRDGFDKNHSEQDLALLNERIKQFTSLFQDAREGDVYLFDYLPESGTHVSLNGNQLGTIPGADFNQALLRIWLGEKPVTKALKDGLLGIE